MDPIPPFPKAIEEKLQSWLSAPIKQELKDQIHDAIENNPIQIIDAFSKELTFGTSGLRALMGFGCNRINEPTIQRASQGFANYLNKKVEGKKAVVICYDNRKHSPLFAQAAAQVLAANHIQCYVARELRPVPYLSFLVRHLQLSAGIMITASHNPKQYNGFKIYGSDGGEIPPVVEKMIEEELLHIDEFLDVKSISLAHPLIQSLSLEATDEAYLHYLEALALQPVENKKRGSSLHITYSSFHGTGITLAPRALARWGFNEISLVKQQCEIDENFSTLANPNPEEKAAYQLGLNTLKAATADILFVNDGDADRIGVAFMHKQEEKILNGNEIAILCLYHICSCLKEMRKLPHEGSIVTTLVTTKLLDAIAESFGISVVKVHTGFKFIAEQVGVLEKQGKAFLFGAEESYGCLLGTYTRDKDGIAAVCLMAEIARSQKDKGQDLVDLLYHIYGKYGVYREKQQSLTFPATEEGMKKILKIMDLLRAKPIESINGIKVVLTEDFLLGMRRVDGKKEQLSFAQSNAISFKLEDATHILLRPSGTEPKLRIHVETRIEHYTSVEEGIRLADEKVARLINEIQRIVQS